MVVGWLRKKQGSVTLSTMNAELVAAFQVTAEMLGIAELVGEIGLTVEMSYKLHVDNQAVIKQIHGEDTSGRAKHIDVRFKLVKDLSRKKAPEVNYCESKAMRADILTKPCRRRDLKSCPHEKGC
ncbi:Retrotransposon protein [Phytophthora megakarya]|uniref:Retrotransposon protein n=1 Tax=Phytophthora megakarya TaxID=4795 RepID=A0A225WVE2_9STRA|nr:Retrotransposon protein [Phytophthora megakarya]